MIGWHQQYRWHYLYVWKCISNRMKGTFRLKLEDKIGKQNWEKKTVSIQKL